MTEPQAEQQKPRLFEGAMRNLKFVVKFIAFAIVFWLLEFAYQYYIASPGDFKASTIRSFAFAGATFIATALLLSAVFKFFPPYAKYWYVRRSLGVTGFFFGVLHVLAAINFIYNADLALVYFSLNPFENPVVFGTIAYTIFLAMALTSTDWAVARLGAKWKMVHRLVYFAFWALIFHFLLINPPALMSLAGYLLLAVTALALAGQLYWFLRFVFQKKTTTKGIIVGVIVIALFLVTTYLAWFSGK